MFVDTPGFDDTYRSDRDILRTIAGWLEEKYEWSYVHSLRITNKLNRYKGDVKLSGVIYTHRITDNRMSGSVCKNLDMFGRLCGDNAAKRVRLVTTMWDRVKDTNTANNRVTQLEGNFWKPLIDAGACHQKFENTRESAWDIVRGATGDSEALLLQEELVDADRRLNETTAGKALYSQFQRLLQEQKDTIKQLSEEAKAQQDPALAKELEAEYKRIEAQLQKTWQEMEELKIPWLRRLMLFFAKKPRSVSTSFWTCVMEAHVYSLPQHTIEVNVPN